MSLFIYTLRNVAGAIVTPPLAFLLIILMVILYLKNKKIIAMQKLILGGSVNSSVELTLSQLVFGILGGSIGSLIFSSLGIVFTENSGIMFLFFISILLAFAKPRLICFSYSAAILGAISILIKLVNEFSSQYLGNLILDIDILGLITFIGIFHIIEGILVMLDGDRGAIPVFTNKDGKILGGYALKRYWVLPVAIMIAISMNNSSIDYSTEIIQSPSWWPLLSTPSNLILLASSVISIFPFYTMLGYSSVTFTRSKRGKAISSGLYILIYGVILTIVAQAARFGILGEILGIIFMPAAHEFMLRYQVRNENKRSPKFVSDEEGLTILEIASDSKIREFGISIEDKLISINGTNINSESDVYSIIKKNLYNASLKIKDSNGIIRDIEFRHDKKSRLGILLVPRNINKEEVVPVNENSFSSVLSDLKDSKDKISDDKNENKKL
ncbi:C-terminal PDZ domain-containing protein [Clostridium sp. DL-VIII]|uniref:signal protein PDZ n=1 Tax=Clostridium sp. DL-VIII TaxID=641107 RepID=UPI00023B02AD|nr:signal protein PDZ [Clostridium sp. DL-VIII]EHJ02295.1 C-terminal PDZ domain-containing protein [Clostridium sp. DL-VIII]